MRFSLVLVGTLVGLATALPQRGNGKAGVGRPAGQNNQNNQGNAVQSTPTAQAVNTAAPNAQAPAAAAPTGKGKGKGNGAQNAATSAVNNQPAQNTAAPGNANNGNANNGNGKGKGKGNGQGAQQFNAALVPDFGIKAGQQPDGTGNCIGNNNVKIPCSCPPDRQQFIQKVQAAAAAGNSEGVPINFPTDNSSASKKARIGASIIVLQNLNGKGVGCPAAATTFLAQQAAA